MPTVKPYFILTFSFPVGTGTHVPCGHQRNPPQGEHLIVVVCLIRQLLQQREILEKGAKNVCSLSNCRLSHRVSAIPTIAGGTHTAPQNNTNWLQLYLDQCTPGSSQIMMAVSKNYVPCKEYMAAKNAVRGLRPGSEARCK